MEAANAVLRSVVQTATTAITDEIGLLLGVQKELFFIKEELEMMQAFLRTASTEKVKVEVVSTWVKQVQELAFDVEDCLQKALMDVRKGCLPVMWSLIKRDRIARKIRTLKARIEDVSKRNLRYNLINKDSSDSTYIDENTSIRVIDNAESLLVGLEEPKRELFKLILNASSQVEQKVISVVGMGGLGKTTLVRKVYDSKDQLGEKFKFFAWVTVQHPFNMEEFIECLVKQFPSDTIEVDNKGGKPERNLIYEKMREKITGYLTGVRYFIVLDDLSSISEWEKINNLLPTSNVSQIVVTTRLETLAQSISNHGDNIYKMKELSEDDAFDLFCKAVYKSPHYHLVNTHNGRGTQDEARPENSSTEIMEEDSDVQKRCINIVMTEDMRIQAGLIITSCGQLPLSIVTIGSYLATKPKTSAEWKKMHEHLSSELAHNPDLQGVVKTVLTSSYNGMPYHLKACLLYLSVFHNHKEIRRSRIIRRWMADGYVMKDRKKMAEEVGESYFYDLMGRSFIQPSQMGKTVDENFKSCNIHDMMYGLILGKALEDNTVSLLEDEHLITMTDKVRHLVITGACEGEDLSILNLSHMRSLSIFGKVRNYLNYPRMKLLRVLDLEGTLGLNNRDLRNIDKLCHLKYLGLRGTKITKLPESLGKLSELETLDIKNTYVVRLPTVLKKLQKLSYLRGGYYENYFENYENAPVFRDDTICGRCTNFLFRWLTKDLEEIYALVIICCLGLLCTRFCCCCNRIVFYDDIGSNGMRVFPGIGELRSLNNVGMIDVGESEDLAKDIQNLINLRKLALTGFSKKNGTTIGKVIDRLKQLRSLVLSASDDEGLSLCLESVSSPPKYLQSLKLHTHLGKFPGWINTLENLVKMVLQKTQLETDDIKIIEKLPSLMILHLLKESFKGKQMCFGQNSFPVLKVMVLEIKELEVVSIKDTALQRLVQLEIDGCYKLQKVSGPVYISNLLSPYYREKYYSSL